MSETKPPAGIYKRVPFWIDFMGRFCFQVGDEEERSRYTYREMTDAIDRDLKKMEAKPVRVEAVRFEITTYTIGTVTSFTDNSRPRFNRSEVYAPEKVFKFAQGDLRELDRLILELTLAEKAVRQEIGWLKSVLLPVVYADVYPKSGEATAVGAEASTSEASS